MTVEFSNSFFFFIFETRVVTNIRHDYTPDVSVLYLLLRRLASGRSSFAGPSVAFYGYTSARRLLRSLIPWEYRYVRYVILIIYAESLLINCRVNNAP